MSGQNERRSLESRLKGLEAYLLSQEQGPDAALDQLKDESDPEVLRRKLSILLDAERTGEAAVLVKGKEPHPRWYDKALCAFKKTGETQEAKRIIEWATMQDDLVLRDRCLVLYTECCYLWAQENHKGSEVIFPGRITDDERVELLDACQTVKPIIDRVVANQRIQSELECAAVQHVARINYLLADFSEASRLGKLLYTKKPIPLLTGQLVINRVIEPLEDLPIRLREEQAGSFEAHVLAALVEGENLGKPEQAFDAAKKIGGMAKSEGERKNLLKVLHQLAHEVGPEKLKEVGDIAIELLGRDNSYLQILKVDQLIQEEQFVEAKKLLDGFSDKKDSAWLQSYAQCLLHENKPKEAVNYLLKATEIIPHPDIFKSAARIAFQQGLYDLAAEALEQALEAEPKNTATLLNLASTCFKKGDFERASQVFEELVRLQPEDSSLYLNRAMCLTQIGQRKQAQDVYEALCERPDAPLAAFLGRAYLLKTENPVAAFESIKPLRNEHWEDPQYLQAYLDLSYTAGQDTLGHQAFQKLLQLQSEGKTERTIIERKTIDDLLAYKKSFEKRAEQVHNFTIRGRIPWILASEMLGHTSYIGWKIRTQPLPWLNDEPNQRAKYSLYCTNGFHARRDEAGTIRLRQLQCPTKGAEVVADLSSLITLHRLNLIEEALDYFGQVSVPQLYIQHMMLEANKLVFHQPSYIASLTKIKNMLDACKISVLDEPGLPNQRPMPYVNEYAPPEMEKEHFYRIRDLAETVHSAGKISDAKRSELMTVAHEPQGADQDHPQLSISDAILVDLATLQTLDGQGILEILLDAFRIHIIPGDHRTVTSEMQAVAHQEEGQQWHKELTDILSGDSRIKKVPICSTGELNEESGITDISVAAVCLAQQLDNPLLADDRVCQALALNERRDDLHAAFGSDHVVTALLRDEAITKEQTADCILQLMRWRYRFIIPSQEILNTLMARYKEHSPGQELREVALYFHDCLRDPGLFGGLEQTDYPESMASRLFTTILTIVVEFMATIWQDQTFTDNEAAQITRWALHELVPSHPKALGMRGRSKLEVIPKAILGQFLLQAPLIPDAQRANLAVRTVAKALDMEPDDEPTEYLKLVAETINES